MGKTVEDVLLEMVGLCESFGLSYAILGGLAVRVHGIPRPTYDVDFELSVSDQQLTEFFDAAEKLGYEVAAPYRTGLHNVDDRSVDRSPRQRTPRIAERSTTITTVRHRPRVGGSNHQVADPPRRKPSTHFQLPMIPYSPEYFAARDAALRIATAGFAGLDDMDPKAPCGHAYGLHKSAMLTSDYRTRLRRGIVDVTPQEVIECLIAADIKNWVLMGLHGYVGYLPMPRATQDVDVMVPYSQRKRAADAVGTRWPMLTRVELPQVIRFVDSTDLDPDGHPKPVIEVMNPGSPLLDTILNEHVLIDSKTNSRYPTVEAALASKYAALISPDRSRDKKEYGAADFRKIVRANHQRVDRESLVKLANQVWEQGGVEILRFIELTLTDQPLPI